MRNEEEKIFAGELFWPGAPELKAIKLRSHNLCSEYNRTFEDETEKRTALVHEIFGSLGQGCFFQGPLAITASTPPSATGFSATSI